ncbi:hypothetical protein DEA06_08285 [Microbacterium sp. Gd 4-13]|nr:hypothetical protein DEA06_08285 [Microbacterium sp. Gd 4-13]
MEPGRSVRIVGDGMVMRADAFGGAPVPVLVLDCTPFPDIREAIRVAEYEPDGDVKSVWGTGGGRVGLLIELIRPAPTSFLIDFDLATQGILPELAMGTGLIEIKAGHPQSTFKSTFKESGMYVEVPSREDFTPWPAVFVKALMEQARRGGAKTVDARRAAEKTYEYISSVANARMRGGTESPSEAVH